MTTAVGRLRPCNVLDWKFTVLSHNTIRGAAGAALLNAELLKAKGIWDENLEIPNRANRHIPGNWQLVTGHWSLGLAAHDRHEVRRDLQSRTPKPLIASLRLSRAAAPIARSWLSVRWPKVTDSLLAMGKAAGSGDRKTALKMARALRERHYDTAGELLGTALFTEFHGNLGSTSRISTNFFAASALLVKSLRALTITSLLSVRYSPARSSPPPFQRVD